jgi:hypothetical protein
LHGLLGPAYKLVRNRGSAGQHPELVTEMAAKLEEYTSNGRSVARRADATVGQANATINKKDEP